MLCPKCKSGKLKTIDSRLSGDTTRRRRMCLECKTRFSTLEIPEYEYKNLKGKEKLMAVVLKTAAEIMKGTNYSGEEERA